MTRDVIAFDGFDVGVDLDRWPAKILRALLRRHYEKHELRLVARLLKPGDRVLELGSAIGVVALAAARVVAPEHIICFDANPDMVAQAHDNFARNGQPISVASAVMVAGQEAPAEVTFYRTPYFLSSSLTPQHADATPIVVATRSLAQAIADINANVLIVDIEGGEFDLLGAADLSGIHRLILELHVSMADVAACMELIAKLEHQGLSLNMNLTAHNVFVFQRDFREELRDDRKTTFITGYLTSLERSDAGDRAGAAATLTRALEANVSNPHAFLLLSQLQFQSGLSQPALKSAEQALRLDPGNEDTLEQLGVVHSARGDLDKARIAYAHAIDITPHRPLFHAGLGVVLARQNRPRDALDALRAATALNPARANTLEQVLALASRRDKFAGDNASAPSVSADGDMDGAMFWSGLAGILAQSFRFPDAAASLEWALKLAPGDTALHCGLAMLVATPKDIRKALEAV